MAKKKPKLEKLAINLKRGGELRFEKAYNASEAARIATKWARKGWSATVQPWGSGSFKQSRTPATFMTCEPSKKKAYWSDPDPKAHAICKLTPAFKKRVKGR